MNFFLNAQVRRPFSVVSQIGVIQVADMYGDLRINSMRGLYNYSVFLNHHDTFVLSGHILRDRLLVTFVYVDPYVTHEQALTIVDRVIKKLLMPEQEVHVNVVQSYEKVLLG